MTAAGLGPVTEARFAEAFAERAIVTAKMAAQLIGVDIKTLNILSCERVIRSVRRGNVRAYTEHDLRAYLAEEAPTFAPPPSRATTRRIVKPASKVLKFSERKSPRQ